MYGCAFKGEKGVASKWGVFLAGEKGPFFGGLAGGQDARNV
jgi:hypothetical protein